MFNCKIESTDGCGADASAGGRPPDPRTRSTRRGGGQARGEDRS